MSKTAVSKGSKWANLRQSRQTLTTPKGRGFSDLNKLSPFEPLRHYYGCLVYPQARGEVKCLFDQGRISGEEVGWVREMLDRTERGR